ncbi:MAG: hypothetical protein WDO17_20835 [Alphaproteobacteria bacterium]
MRHITPRTISKAAFSLSLAIFGAMPAAHADEGGVGAWLPGTFGSLAATPLTPGWSLATVFLHVSADASGNVAAAREITLGRFNRNVLVDLNVNIKARPDLIAVAPTYVFGTPVLGGQLAVSLMGVLGRSYAALDGSLTLAGAAGP